MTTAHHQTGTTAEIYDRTFVPANGRLALDQAMVYAHAVSS